MGCWLNESTRGNESKRSLSLDFFFFFFFSLSLSRIKNIVVLSYFIFSPPGH